MSEVIENEEVKDIQIDFKPAVINILEEEKFKESISRVVAEYTGHVPSVENLTVDKKTRASLNKLITKIETRRKEIKKTINVPYAEFEGWYKKAIAPMEKVIETIDAGIKKIETEQKEARKKVVHELLVELTTDTEVDSRIFENFVDDWAKASNFNDTKPKKQLIDSITYVIDGEKQKIAEYEANKDTISNFCFGNNVSDTPYIRMLDSGKSVSEVMSAISEDVLFEKQRKEAEEKRKEAERQRQAELEKQQQEFETRKLEASFNSAASVSTKVIQSEPEKTKSSPDEEIAEVSGGEIVQKYRAVIEIYFASIEEKNQWKQVMIDNGFGDFKATEFKKI
ncbi:DUF1351 domain-containing protein [Lactococcus lactis]|uniref:DUF1351 domain-containing protein n=1 Tax=Lactococcus lactis TaxID=1358 RepID=UPI00288D95D2|nr:DUF1351 domain-containing protein [Lactococcus lactis]MDT2898648.1 DUF1351 domain-containing protein [Lactococcus lactis]MDT2949035.1 DUF1351 domain-containing protein [Lactococcus lactis]